MTIFSLLVSADDVAGLANQEDHGTLKILFGSPVTSILLAMEIFDLVDQ